MAWLEPPEADAADHFGGRVILGANQAFVATPGDDAAVGEGLTDDSDTDTGVVHRFTKSGGGYEWEQALQPVTKTGTGNFGRWLALDELTGVVAVSNQSRGLVYDPADYEVFHEGIGPGTYGQSIALSHNELMVADMWTDNNQGTLYFYRRGGVGQEFVALNTVDSFRNGAWDNFGYRSASSGSTVVATGKEEGWAAGIYTSNPGLGPGSTPCGETSPERDFGGVYVFVNGGPSYGLQTYIKSPNPWCKDYFGSALAIRDDLLLVGAEGESTEGSGLSATPRPNTTGPTRSGGVYLYRRHEGTWYLLAHIKSSVPTADARMGGTAALGDDFLAFGTVAWTGSAPHVGAGPDATPAVTGEVWACVWE